MTGPLVVIGAGGHARVTADALLASGQAVAGFIDADPKLHGTVILGLSVLGGEDLLMRPPFADSVLVNGIGGTGVGGAPSLRRYVQERLERAGRTFAGVRHPASIVSPFAAINATAQLFAASVVQLGARIGKGCIVNTGAIIEHDCDVGGFTHCAPGSLVCGDVRLGEDSHVGAGAVIRQGVRLGGGTVVGAGAVVVRDYEGRGPLCGVPAGEKVGR